MSDTIRGLLAFGADDATALIAPDGASLDYRGLRRVVDSLSREFAAYGVTASDRVAISVPNGPTAAITFLASASCAAAAPLNPKYRESEFEFYLKDLNPKLLIVSADSGDAEFPVPSRASQISPLPLAQLPPGQHRSAQRAFRRR